LTAVDANKMENMRISLINNKLEHNPLLILIAWEVYSKRTLEDEALDMYTLMNDFYKLQFATYYNIETFNIEKQEQFYTTLGWYAVNSDAVEPICSLSDTSGSSRGSFKNTLQQEIANNNVKLECRRNVRDWMQYRFTVNV
jgi:hypothetical protein